MEKNIVLITIDCLRYDRCGFNGHHRNTTPTLDLLSTNSLIYDNCFSTGPYTTESVPGILAGQHSYNGYQYGENVGYKAIPTDAPTLATELANEGYNTAAVISNPHLTENRNFDRGFDIFENYRSESNDDHDESESRWKLGSRMYTLRQKMRDQRTRYNPLSLLYTAYRFGQLQTGWPTTDGAELTKRSKEVISNLSSDDDPFFLWTHYMDAHAPISPDRANANGLGSTAVYKSLFWDASRAGRFRESNYGLLYDRALRYVDTQISNLIAHLEDVDALQDTTIIVTGDHGEILFDRQGVYGHPPHYHYDGLLHVPLLAYNTDIPSNRIQKPVSLAWMNELVSQMTGVEMVGFPANFDGDILSNDRRSNIVISDTLDDMGHTVTVRDDEDKVIIHRGLGTEGINWEYGKQPICYKYMLDHGERASTQDIPSHLLDTANTCFRSKSKLPEIHGEFDAVTEQRLQDLGYKM